MFTALGHQKKILLTTPSTRTELGKTAFSSYAPNVWNELQATLNLESLPPLNTFTINPD